MTERPLVFRYRLFWWIAPPVIAVAAWLMTQVVRAAWTLTHAPPPVVYVFDYEHRIMSYDLLLTGDALAQLLTATMLLGLGAGVVWVAASGLWRRLRR